MRKFVGHSEVHRIRVIPPASATAGGTPGTPFDTATCPGPSAPLHRHVYEISVFFGARRSCRSLRTDDDVGVVSRAEVDEVQGHLLPREVLPVSLHFR